MRVLGYSVFAKVPRLDATDVTQLQRLYDAQDLGALERGAAAPPHCGPRSD